MNNTIQEIEQEFALETAISNIEVYCEYAMQDEMRWYDVTRLEDRHGAVPVEKALIYLKHRSHLTRHPTNANWVRPYVNEQEHNNV